MTTEKSDLLTAGNIAKVKKAIQTLGVKPVAKKGVCSYYSKDVLPKVKAAIS